MNAFPQAEPPQEGVRRLFAREISDGFVLAGLHPYQAATGEVVFYRVRLKHADGRKVIGPMRLDGLRHERREPARPKAGRLLYRMPGLLDADASTPVWIVEGEACADLLVKLGKVATTSGSATSAAGADWSPLRGRHTVIWPDNDGPGRMYAEVLTVRLQALDCSVTWVNVDALALPEGGDVVDWSQADPEGDLNTVPLMQPRVGGDASAPEPLRRPIRQPEPYPLTALGPILQPAAESLQRVIQMPVAIGAASLLAAASLATQALADVHIDGRDIPLSLSMVTVGESGERKSAADREAMRAAIEYEMELTRAYEAQNHSHDAQLAEWESAVAAARACAKKQRGAGLAKALEAIGPKPLPPLVPCVVAADFTAEGLAKLLAVGIPSVGAFTDEAALVFGGHGMTKEAVARTAATLCKLWDGGTLDRVRALDGATKLHGRRLAVHLLAQPVIAERAFSDPILSGQGFLARCLLAWPDSTIGLRQYRAESLRDDPAIGRMAYRLGELHRQPLPLTEGSRQQLQPRALRLSDNAKATWVRFHDAIELAMTSGAQFTHVKSWASKTPEQALRIAGVFTLLESNTANVIEVDALERAADIALWHLSEAARLADAAEVPPYVLDAEALLHWCHHTGRHWLYSTVALQYGPGRIRVAATFDDAIAELERRGWALAFDGGMELDGAHRKRVWRIHPAKGD